MIKRYISPIVGTGSAVDPVRAKVADYGVSYTSVIFSMPNGAPKLSWCLVKVNALDHTALLADPQLFPLLEALLDTPVSALTPGVQSALQAKLGSLGIDSALPVGVTARDIVNRVGRFIEPQFDEKNFWID